jgi:hypothetical protein
MSALHAAAVLANLSPAEIDAVSVLASGFNTSPCPFDDDTVDPPDNTSLVDDLPPPLTQADLEKMLNVVVPEGVVFSINGNLVAPGTRVIDAMDEFFDEGYDNYEDYGYPEDDEEETCRGCIDGMNGGYYHSGPDGCLC